MRQFNEERNEFQEQIRSLEEENQKYLDKIIKTSKETAQLFERQRDPQAAEVMQYSQKNGASDHQEKTVVLFFIRESI